MFSFYKWQGNQLSKIGYHTAAYDLTTIMLSCRLFLIELYLLEIVVCNEIYIIYCCFFGSTAHREFNIFPYDSVDQERNRPVSDLTLLNL